ncbi:MAG: Asp-tRNA(Asn)/Glu-tRNA(Gln) amidotransferase subunit GatC [Candidatus Heimdallarchaeota archaeon]
MITDEVLKKVLTNSRISLEEAEFSTMRMEMESILEAFKIIEYVDLEGLTPAYHPLEISNVWREDKVETFEVSQSLLSQMDTNFEGYIWGPKIKRSQK